MARSEVEEPYPCESMLRVRHTARLCCGWKSKSMTANLEISREQRVLRVTLNRPEKRNALTSDMCRDIADAARPLTTMTL